MRHRRLRSFAALAALVALVLVPVLHGAHAPHLEHAASIGVAGAAYDAAASPEAAACPLCFAASQARTAIAQPALLVAPETDAATSESSPHADFALRTAPHAPFPPRAPPARV